MVYCSQLALFTVYPMRYMYRPTSAALLSLCECGWATPVATVVAQPGWPRSWSLTEHPNTAALGHRDPWPPRPACAVPTAVSHRLCICLRFSLFSIIIESDLVHQATLTRPRHKRWRHHHRKLASRFLTTRRTP